MSLDNNHHLARQYPWVIKDWAGNLMPWGRFKDFDDAEEYLPEKLGDDYEEYYIQEDTTA